MHIMPAAALAALALFAISILNQADHGHAADDYVPKVPVKITVTWKDEKKNGGEAAKALAYKVVYAAALACVSKKIEYQLKQLACRIAWSCASVVPSIPGLIAKVGMDYAKCLPKAIGMQMAAAFGKMITVVGDTPALDKWGIPEIKQFIWNIGNQFPSVSLVPNIGKLPWLAPLLRFAWNLELKTDKEEPKQEESNKAMEDAVEETEKEETEMSEDDRKTWLASFGFAKDAVANVANKVLFPTLSLADFVLFSWYGMEIVQDTLCDWMWAVMLNSAQTWTDQALAGVKVNAESALYLLPKKYVDASASLADFAKKREEENAKIQDELKARRMAPAYWSYLHRMIANGLAKDLKSTKPTDPLAEIIDAKVAKKLTSLTEYAVKPKVANVVLRVINWDRYSWMENYDSPTDRDIGRAVDSAATYCWKGETEGGYSQADMYALLCENSEHITSMTRENEIALIKAAMGDANAAKDDAVSNYVKANVIDVKMATAALGKAQKTLEAYFSDKNAGIADNKFLRYLLTKGMLFVQCVQLQTVYLLYDAGRLKANPKITMETRLDDIKKWKEGGGLIRRTIKEVCHVNFVEFAWDKNVSWASLKDKSEIARFLGLALLAKPSNKEPKAQDIPCLDYHEKNPSCYH